MGSEDTKECKNASNSCTPASSPCLIKEYVKTCNLEVVFIKSFNQTIEVKYLHIPVYICHFLSLLKLFMPTSLA